MNEKGFTLIELLGVIILLSIIMSVTTVAVIGVLNKTKDKGYDILISNIKISAQQYFEECENNGILGGTSGSMCSTLRENGTNCETDKCATVSLDSLIKYGFLKSSATNENGDKIIENPKTNEDISSCVVEIKKTINKDYVAKYEFNANSATVACPALSLSEQSVENLELNINTSNVKPNFSVTSCSSGCNEQTVGVYTAQDDLGTSYYFRGDVTNNYVEFAGYYWRIIRINGDGSIRMIFDGAQPNDNGSTSNDKIATNARYSPTTSFPDMDRALNYARYSRSNIKSVLTNWYRNSITNRGYSKYVADSIFCDSYEREVAIELKPSLKCFDGFTSNIGLIMADEIIFAGGALRRANTKYYLTSPGFWTMTIESASEGSRPNAYMYTGTLGSNSITNSFGVRPVISLKPDAISGGNGTKNNPYTVG